MHHPLNDKGAIVIRFICFISVINYKFCGSSFQSFFTRKHPAVARCRKCLSKFCLILGCPCFKIGGTCVHIKTHSFQKLRSLTGNSKLLICPAHSTAAGSCKGNDFLSCKIVLFKKGVNDGRRNISPNRKADKNSIILLHILHTVCHRRTELLVVHLDRGAAFPVRPVQVSPRVFVHRDNLV